MKAKGGRFKVLFSDLDNQKVTLNIEGLEEIGGSRTGLS